MRLKMSKKIFESRVKKPKSTYKWVFPPVWLAVHVLVIVAIIVIPLLSAEDQVVDIERSRKNYSSKKQEIQQFLVDMKLNNRITFCHSSYYDPPLKVVNEDIILKSPLTDSKYRVIGKILGDKMMLKWLNGKGFAVIYDYFQKRVAPAPPSRSARCRSLEASSQKFAEKTKFQKVLVKRWWHPRPIIAF
jgi:hypothetical protein